MTKPKSILHIGMPKTGSTTLQSHVFPNHPELVFLGRRLGIKYLSPTIEKFADALSHRPQKIGDAFVADMQADLQTFRTSERKLIYSTEALTRGDLPQHRARAKALAKIFGESSILLTLRNPLDFIESIYFQTLKSYNLSEHKQNQLLQELQIKPPQYFSITEWLEVVSDESPRRAFSHLNVHAIAQIYAEQFGKENVHILIFEKLRETPDAYYRELSDRVGIDGEITCQLAKDKVNNFRWTEEMVARLKAIDNSFFRRWFFRKFANMKQIKKYLGLTTGRALRMTSHEEYVRLSAKKATAVIPDQWKDRILEIARPQFSAVAQDWNLPLARYGYPVESTASQGELKRAA